MSGIQRGVSVAITGSVSELDRAMAQAKRAIASVRDPVRELALATAELKKKQQEMGLTDAQYAAALAMLTVQSERLRKKNEELAASFDAVAAAKDRAGREAINTRNRSAGLKRQAFFQGIDEQAADGQASLAERLAAYKQSKADERERIAALHASGQQYMQQFQTPKERHAERIAEASRMMQQGAISAEQYSKALRNIEYSASLTGRAMAGLKSAVSGALAPIAIMFAGFEALRKAITLKAEMDASVAKLKVFTGSLRTAKDMIEQIRQMSENGPVDFIGGQRAVTTMLQFGVAQKDVMKAFKAIAEITAGDTMRMENLSLAFGQSAAAGRLMGQELLQMVNAGFNPLKVISDQTGESLADLKKKMSDGLISFDMVMKSFIDDTSAGGRHFGLLGEIGETSMGKMSRAGAALQKMMLGLGEALAPISDEVFNSFAETASDAALALKDLGESIKYVKSLGNAGASQGSDSGSLLGILGLVGQDSVTEIMALYDALDLVSSSYQENAARAVSALDRLSKHSAIFRLFAGDRGMKAIQEEVRIQREMDKIRERRDKGEKLTDRESMWLGRDDKAREMERKMTGPELTARLKKYNEDLKAAKSKVGRQELFSGLVDDIGLGNLTPDQRAIYKRIKAGLDEIDAATRRSAQAQKDVSEAFDKSNDKMRDQINELKFGEDAWASYSGFIESFSGKSKEALLKLFSTAKSLKDIQGVNMRAFLRRAGASEEQINTSLSALDKFNKKQAELNKLKADQEAKEKKADEDKDKRKEAEKKKEEKLNEILKAREDLKKKADEITKKATRGGELGAELGELMAMQKQGLITAKVFEQSRRDLLSKYMGDTSLPDGGLAPAIQKGSQEAYRVMVSGAADKNQLLLNESRRQTASIEATPIAIRASNALLQTLVENSTGNAG